jgi:hypothetical protein
MTENLAAESCASCRFCLITPADPKAGACRRNPPMVIAQAWMGRPGEVKMGSALSAQGQQTLPVMVYEVSNLASFFPQMNLEEGWCGEWAERVTASMN